MKQYIVLLWPSAEDVEVIEQFRRDICVGCDTDILKWPAHVTLFYGILVQDHAPLLSALRSLARETRAFPLSISGLGSFGTSVAYLQIKPCAEITRLQKKIREIVQSTCDIQCDYSQVEKPDGTLLSPAEIRNMEEWGSYYPFSPHITLAQNLAPEQMEQVREAGLRFYGALPGELLADHMSLAVFETGSTVSDTVEAMSFARDET